MSAADVDRRDCEEDRVVTTVEVKGTGRLYDRLPAHRFEYSFEGTTLREFMEAFLSEYDVAEFLIAETPEDAVAHGWAPAPEQLPADFRANPAGDQTRAYARVAINGRFNEHLGGFDTELHDGDRVALMYPFMYCC